MFALELVLESGTRVDLARLVKLLAARARRDGDLAVSCNVPELLRTLLADSHWIGEIEVGDLPAFASRQSFEVEITEIISTTRLAYVADVALTIRSLAWCMCSFAQCCAGDRSAGRCST